MNNLPFKLRQKTLMSVSHIQKEDIKVDKGLVGKEVSVREEEIEEKLIRGLKRIKIHCINI